MTFIGRSVPRLEDRPLVTGRGRFAADVFFPRMLHMRVVRSAHAHGRIVSIDAGAALALPGVVAVWTFADVAGIPPIEIHHLETLTQASITKAKGLGEGGAIGPPAAVVNAINDALSPFGVSIDEFPATPQRIRAALRAALREAPAGAT
jgi:carbon-monoxide dehydrogenase large subunit